MNNNLKIKQPLHEGQRVKINSFAYRNGKTGRGIIKKLMEVVIAGRKVEQSLVLIDGNKKPTKFAQCWLIPDDQPRSFKSYLVEVYHDHLDTFRSIRVHRGTFEQNRDNLNPSMIATHHIRAASDREAMEIAKGTLNELKKPQAIGKTYKYKLDPQIFD